MIVKDELTGLLVSSESVAVQVTVVVPIAKVEPVVGEQLTESYTQKLWLRVKRKAACLPG